MRLLNRLLFFLAATTLIACATTPKHGDRLKTLEAWHFDESDRYSFAPQWQYQIEVTATVAAPPAAVWEALTDYDAETLLLDWFSRSDLVSVFGDAVFIPIQDTHAKVPLILKISHDLQNYRLRWGVSAGETSFRADSVGAHGYLQLRPTEDGKGTLLIHQFVYEDPSPRYRSFKVVKSNDMLFSDVSCCCNGIMSPWLLAVNLRRARVAPFQDRDKREAAQNVLLQIERRLNAPRPALSIAERLQEARVEPGRDEVRSEDFYARAGVLLFNIRTGNLKNVALLLARDPRPINRKQSLDGRPLEIALRNRDLEMVDLLLKHGADPKNLSTEQQDDLNRLRQPHR